MSEHRDPIRDRFEALKNSRDDSDWSDVAARAALRPRRRTWVLALAAALAALALPAIGLGLGTGFNFFNGKKAPERVVKFFAGFHRGFPAGMDPGVIVNQTRRVLVTDVPEVDRAVVWVAPTHGGGFCDLLEFGATSGGGCAEPPIGFSPSLWFTDSMSPPAAVVIGATDLPNAAKIAIEFEDGESVSVPFVWISEPMDAGFFLYAIPRDHWPAGHGPTAVVIRNADSETLARKPFRFTIPRRLRNAPAPPYRHANEQPLQHGAAPGAELDVYRSGLVHVHFTSTDSGPYAFLAPKVRRAERHTVTIECGHVSFGPSGWRQTAGGTYADFGEDLQAVVSTPAQPFDECSVRGHYGRRWDEHVGYHNAVEVPFNAEAERFFAEQAAARRLAYFVRSPKMHEIREALKAGGNTPSTAEIASRFDSSVVALTDRGQLPPPGKVGVWSDERGTIVASERADDGRRIYVTLVQGKLGTRNTQELAFVF
jgi:hypothetical protein